MLTERNIIAGNFYDKYHSSNLIAQFLTKRFIRAIIDIVYLTKCSDIHEVGCGEGHLAYILSRIPDINLRASDFSEKIILQASQLYPRISFYTKDIYELHPITDSACLIVCCEVLEHLKDPEKALRILSRVAKPYLLVSVPREPLWRILNVLRGKYLKDFGNTPGHLQNWSKASIINSLSNHYKILRVINALPWTIALCKTRQSTHNDQL